MKRLSAWLAVVLASLIAPAGCGPMTFVVGMAPGDQQLQTTVVESQGDFGGNRVAIVDVTGLIINANKPGLLQQGENPVSLLHEKLELARTDDRVKAVILRLNTPGGTVTASDAMYREVLRFRERTGKPVVVLMMDVAASGGYYLACAGDHVVAYPTTITGSIGVIVQTLSVKDALNRIGVRTDAITSGPNKDAGSPFSTLTPEHRAVFEQLVSDFYGRFTDVVRSSRPNIPSERFAELTDGRVLSGDQALDAGLVDQVGDIQDAFAEARRRAGISRADLVIYHRPLQYIGSPYATAAAPTTGTAQTQINLFQLNMAEAYGESAAGFWYLWQPVSP